MYPDGLVRAAVPTAWDFRAQVRFADDEMTGKPACGAGAEVCLDRLVGESATGS